MRTHLIHRPARDVIPSLSDLTLYVCHPVAVARSRVHRNSVLPSISWLARPGWTFLWGQRRREAQGIRDDSGLTDVQICAEVIKHVRIELEQDGVTSTLSSTGVDTADPKTWKVSGVDLVQVAHSAFATLGKIPELNAPST
jgi:hypothetical protein